MVKLRLFIVIALCAGVAMSLAAAGARAVITVPIPADVASAPPPIPALPAAGETPPPAEVISDPIEPAAVCGGWLRQDLYGGAWPAGSTWWEYRCIYEYPQCGPGACNADWGPYVWIDYFYWDGSNAVFYGEFFGDYYFDSMYSASGCSYWWDAPTSHWYLIQCPVVAPVNNAPTASVASTCSGLSCTFDGSGSTDSDGTIVAYEWIFGDGTAASGVAVQHAYPQPGTYTVTMTVTDDDGAWNRDSKTVTIESANVAPTSAFTFSCSGLSCSYDGSGSSDSDGAIAGYTWSFGDGSSGSGKTATHTYAGSSGYAVTLTVTDNTGATASESKAVVPISLTARGDKLLGLQKADLSWSGPDGASFDVYRNGFKIATVQTTAYTDSLNRRGSASYTYRVCAPALSSCSNEAKVTF